MVESSTPQRDSLSPVAFLLAMPEAADAFRNTRFRQPASQALFVLTFG